MRKVNENGHIESQTYTLTTFYARSQLPDHWAGPRCRWITNHVKLMVLNHLPCWMLQLNMVRGESCMTRGVDSSKKTLNTTSGNEAKLSWNSEREEKRWLRHHRLFIVLFIYIEKGKSYGDRLRKNGSCILRFLNHQPKLNYTSILSVELIARTPKSVVTS